MSAAQLAIVITLTKTHRCKQAYPQTPWGGKQCIIAAENECRLKWKAVRHEMHTERNILCCKQIVCLGNLSAIDKKRIRQGFIINLKWMLSHTNCYHWLSHCNTQKQGVLWGHISLRCFLSLKNLQCEVLESWNAAYILCGEIALLKLRISSLVLTKDLSKLWNVLEGHSRNPRNASRAVWADNGKAISHHNTGEIIKHRVMMYKYVF